MDTIHNPDTTRQEAANHLAAATRHLVNAQEALNEGFLLVTASDLDKLGEALASAKAALGVYTSPLCLDRTERPWRLGPDAG